MPSEPRLPLSIPHLAGNEWAYVKECLDTGWVSSVGSFVTRFEQATAAYTGIAHAVAVINGTAALHTALLVAGVRPGDEVIVPALTFVATVNAVRYCGAEPVFMDADPGTWQMDVAKLRRFLATRCEVRDGACVNRTTGRRVRAVMPVHLLGLACEIDTIVTLAREHGLLVVEDATEGMGVRYRGRHVGTFGDVGAISFNGNKIITTGGGGMLVTADAERARHARYLTTQAKDDELEYFHNEIGYNYRLTNVLSALGLAQLEQLDGFVAERRAVAARYTAAFSGRADVTPMPLPEHVEPTYWLYTMLLKPGTSLDSRRAVIRALHARGIEARPLWYPVPMLPPYRDAEAFEVEHALDLHARAVSLPSSAGLSMEDVDRCVAAVDEAVAGGGAC